VCLFSGAESRVTITQGSRIPEQNSHRAHSHQPQSTVYSLQSTATTAIKPTVCSLLTLQPAARITARCYSLQHTNQGVQQQDFQAPTAPQHHSTTTSQLHSTTASQHHSITASQIRCDVAQHAHALAPVALQPSAPYKRRMSLTGILQNSSASMARLCG
jgi:hypothetical protein